MKLLKPPIGDRADVCAYTFPGDGSCDVDALAAQIAANAMRHEFTMFFQPTHMVHELGGGASTPPPVVRVVPVAESDAYAEASDLLAKKLARAVAGATAVVVGPDTVELTAPGMAAPERHTIRLVQVLGS